MGGWSVWMGREMPCPCLCVPQSFAGRTQGHSQGYVPRHSAWLYSRAYIVFVSTDVL